MRRGLCVACSTLVALLGLCCALIGYSAEWVPAPYTQVIAFSGSNWLVKASENKAVGPGPNYFSGQNVWVRDAELHLRISERDGRWYSAEIVSAASFGFGTYRFRIQSDVADLDPNVVLGLFTWSDDPSFSHREIDIEVSRWGDPGGRNAQCVVQPYDKPGAVVRFEVPASLKNPIYAFTWTPEAVTCEIADADERPKSDPPPFRFAHRFTNGIPPAGGENARINLWQLGGQSPARGRSQEVVIAGFRFIPLVQVDP